MQHHFPGTERSLVLSQAKHVRVSRFTRALTAEPAPPRDLDCDRFARLQSWPADDLFRSPETRKGCQSLPGLFACNLLKTRIRVPQQPSRISTSFPISNFESLAVAAPAKPARGLPPNDVRFSVSQPVPRTDKEPTS